ncbi:MAG: MBOAT family protein [Myxococcales bacterium]|nr:MBOAT family protein [Myxococcales bacterium]
MLFPTFDFLLFALPILVGFWALAERPVARVLFLLAASYFFYMAGPKTDPLPAPWYYAGLLLFSTVLDFVAGAAIHRQAEAAQASDEAIRARARRTQNLWLTASLVGNLGLLGYFKYANFFIEAFTDVAGAAGLSIAPLRLDVILPLGISFYTFQSLSYTLDIWRGRLTPEPSFRRFALFVVFFPQLVAGPIVRATQFLPQLHAGPRFSRENLEVGSFRVAKGLVKKVVLGDFVAVQLTDIVFDAPTTYSSAELLLSLYAYTLQIYADFSGYSDIAIGIGLMLGFTLPENFDRPYQSRDIAEYWRRWHMTLSTWLRDYLFFSVLARLGARGGYVAVWLTMFLVGMWHGASWNFVFYANIHAGAMVFNRWNRVRRSDAPWSRRLLWWAVGSLLALGAFSGVGYRFLLLPWSQALGLGGLVVGVALLICWLPQQGGRANAVAHVVLTFHLLVLSRIFFRSPDLQTSRDYIAGLLALDGHGIREGLVSPWVGLVLVAGLVYHFTPRRWVDEHACRLFRRVPGVLLGLAFCAMAYGLMVLMSDQPRAFIYFQF